MELVSKTASPDPVAAGETVRYTIVATNNGPSVARNATITDVVPADTTLVETSLPGICATTGQAAGSTITCDLGDVGATGTVTVIFDALVDAALPNGSTISNSASAGSDTVDPVPGNDDKSVSTTVSAIADVGVAKVASPDPAVPGAPLTYTITVSNLGPSAATGIEITDDVSAQFVGGLATTVVAPPGVTCLLTVSCGPFDLPVGSIDIVVTGTVASARTTDLGNTVDVVATTSTDLNPGNDSATITTPVEPSADLAVTKLADVVDPATVDPTDPITYTVTVVNNGPSDALDVSIVDTPPAFVTLTSVTSGDPTATCDLGTATCDVASIASGASLTMTVVGTVAANAVGSITNSASATSTTPDPNPGDNSDAVTTGVTPVADLGVTKTLLTAPLVPGRPARYELVVTNAGPAAGANVTVTDTLPAGVGFTSVSSPIGSCGETAPDSGVVECTLGTLGSGAGVTILVDVLVDAATTANLVNAVTVDTDTLDTNLANDSVSTDSPVTIQADLAVKKSLDQGSILAGGPFSYTIEITNLGPSVASAPISLTDTLPAQVDAGTPVVLSDTTNCSYTAPTVSCTYNADQPVNGTPLTLTISGAMRSDAGAVALNTASITSIDDPNGANDSSAASATIEFNADLVAAKTFADATLIAGQTTTFTMSVTNRGPSDAVDVSLVDDLPAGMTVVSASPDLGTCDISDPSKVDCTVGTLVDAATASVVVEVAIDPDQAAGPMMNAVTASATTPDRNPETNTGSDSIAVTREADLSVSKSAEAASVLAGNTIRYTIEVANAGPSSAEATVLGDNLVAGVTLVPPLPSDCSEAGGLLECDLGVIAPGTSRTITYEVTVDPAVADATDLVNTAVVSSITPPPNGTPPAPSSTTVTVGTEADVELLSKDAAPDPVVAGEVVTYTLVARNNGPSVSRNTTIIDSFPTALTPVMPLPSGCTIPTTGTNAGKLVCDVGTLVVGGTASVTFSATVGADVTDGATVVNAASVTADPVDPVGGNNGRTEPVAVVAVADITIAKTADPDPAVPGEALTYDIVVTNTGPSDAQNVVVADAVPAALIAVSASASDGSTCSVAVELHDRRARGRRHRHGHHREHGRPGNDRCDRQHGDGHERHAGECRRAGADGVDQQPGRPRSRPRDLQDARSRSTRARPSRDVHDQGHQPRAIGRPQRRRLRFARSGGHERRVGVGRMCRQRPGHRVHLRRPGARHHDDRRDRGSRPGVHRCTREHRVVHDRHRTGRERVPRLRCGQRGGRPRCRSATREVGITEPRDGGAGAQLHSDGHQRRPVDRPRCRGRRCSPGRFRRVRHQLDPGGLRRRAVRPRHARRRRVSLGPDQRHGRGGRDHTCGQHCDRHRNHAGHRHGAEHRERVTHARHVGRPGHHQGPFGGHRSPRRIGRVDDHRGKQRSVRRAERHSGRHGSGLVDERRRRVGADRLYCVPLLARHDRAGRLANDHDHG